MLRFILFLCVLQIASTPARLEARPRPGMTYTDLMQVRKVFSTVISDDGSWIAFEARPDRGDGEVIVRATEGRGEHHIESAAAPQLSTDGSFMAVRIRPSFEARELAEDASSLKDGAMLLRTSDGEAFEFEEIKSFGFTTDARWFVVLLEPREAAADSVDEVEGNIEETAVEENAEPDADAETAPREAGGTLVLHRLSDGAHFEEPDVASWKVSETGALLAIARATRSGDGNGLVVLDLSSDRPVPRVLHAAPHAAYSSLTWAREQPSLAFYSALEPEVGEFEEVALHDYTAGDLAASVRVEDPSVPEGFELPRDGSLRFSRDGGRLYFGVRVAKPDSETDGEPAGEGTAPADSTAKPFDPYAFDPILEDRGVDVWHWNDPRIKSHEKISHEERSREEFLGVVHRERGETIFLADETLPQVQAPERGDVALARDDRPYLQRMTWDGFYHDAWVVNVESGDRKKVAGELQNSVSISPLGGYVAYYRDGVWYLYDTATEVTRDLTSALAVPFADEDDDYPQADPDYGIGGWSRDDQALLVYDKYDIWKFDTATGSAQCITAGKGREETRTYRIAEYERDEPGLPVAESLLLTGFDERKKNSSLWRLEWNGDGLRRLREDDRHYAIVARAREAERFVYTEERYDLFPDLWVAGPDFRRPRQLTDVNPQLRDFDLGRAELVEWSSADGIPLQGILIKPANYDPKKRYPVLVYYYRFFSQRLHLFNDPVINHRPSFYVYAGDDYCVFLPDIRFDIGRPGYSATKCLVPGVQKLVDLGVADPAGIALHGHSWSGYQTAHVITQTDIFACAVAGAPVSNMTSAYGGIRWESGLSRQFQYEMSQSRIGADLWTRRDLYIENSPVFFADRIRTPLLIQFGDEDGAVPWTQGIEMYMAMRRLGKPAVMLQYRGEPHHLKKYPNKLDYSLKMKAFIDHFCKDAPAPEWWSAGVAYEGD